MLVNNAGITGSGQAPPIEARDQVPSTVDPDMVRRVFETNVLGVIRVTNALLPLLRRSPASPSKAALTALTVQYANELRGDGILVNAVAPGYVDTDSNGRSGFLTVAQGAAPVVRLAVLGADGPTGGFFGAEGPVPW